jgi:hypothetical protein
MTVFDIIAGHPVRAVDHLDGPAALARKRDVEGRLSAIKGDASKLDEREALKRENGALDARLRDWKEEQKAANTRRNFAGIGSPLHEAMVERLPADVVGEVEQAALGKLDDRERRSAERKKAKASAVPVAINGQAIDGAYPAPGLVR